MLAIEKYASKYISFNPKAAAECLQSCLLDDALQLLNTVDERERLLLLPHLSTYIASAYLRSIDPVLAAEMLIQLHDSFSASVLMTLPPDLKSNILGNIEPKKRARIDRNMEFTPETAGSFMDSSVLPFKADKDIKDCVKIISAGSRSHYYLYVVNVDDQLIGVTTMRRVFETLKTGTTIEKIMDKNVDAIRSDDGVEELLNNPGWDKFYSMPVVDHKHRFLGIIRYSKIRDIEARSRNVHSNEDAYIAGTALGELYSLGLSAFLGGAAMSVGNKEAK